MGDKRRYVSRDQSDARDKIVGMAEDITGNALKDGFTTRYRTPLRNRNLGYDRDSLYREKYNCPDVMDENERAYGAFPGDI